MPQYFPWWVVITHFLNLFFLLLLFRSGIEVLSAFPEVYWYDDCPPGREWLRFSKKMYGADSRKLWSSLDEEEAWSPVLALPGQKNIGLGRQWHFRSVQFWILTGIVYIVMVFTTGYWQYLIPTHWSIIPDFINAIGTYLHFQIPAKTASEPFEPLQTLSYFEVIVLVHVVATWFSRRHRRRPQPILGFVVNPFEKIISRSYHSRQHFKSKNISRYFRVNGYAPVDHPATLPMAGLRRLGEQTQTTKHNLFYAMDDKGLTEGEGRYGFSCSSVPLHLADNPQTILALKINGAPLPVEHGAPIRVRLETQLGFKMVKWLCAIEFVDDYRTIGMDQGGWREDQQYYASAAGI